VQRVDEVCDRFEDAWKAGQRPRIEDYLGTTPEPERSKLLEELLHVELAYRRQQGETLALEDYVRRFPKHAELIRAIFVAGERSDEVDSFEHQASNGPDVNRPGDVDQPARLGRYRITGTRGRGSFGVVYKGYDDELQREVAIKVLHRHRISTPEEAQAYLTEARTVAGLDHPNIVPVHDVGSTADCPCFIVSKYIDGTDLKTRIEQSRLSLQETVELVATAAEALQHAHQQGLA
jgi:hypothetical protein